MAAGAPPVLRQPELECAAAGRARELAIDLRDSLLTEVDVLALVAILAAGRARRVDLRGASGLSDAALARLHRLSGSAELLVDKMDGNQYSRPSSLVHDSTSPVPLAAIPPEVLGGLQHMSGRRKNTVHPGGDEAMRPWSVASSGEYSAKAGSFTASTQSAWQAKGTSSARRASETLSEAVSDAPIRRERTRRKPDLPPEARVGMRTGSAAAKHSHSGLRHSSSAPDLFGAASTLSSMNLGKASIPTSPAPNHDEGYAGIMRRMQGSRLRKPLKSSEGTPRAGRSNVPAGQIPDEAVAAAAFAVQAMGVATAAPSPRRRSNVLRSPMVGIGNVLSLLEAAKHSGVLSKLRDGPQPFGSSYTACGGSPCGRKEPLSEASNNSRRQPSEETSCDPRVAPVKLASQTPLGDAACGRREPTASTRSDTPLVSAPIYVSSLHKKVAGLPTAECTNENAAHAAASPIAPVAKKAALLSGTQVLETGCSRTSPTGFNVESKRETRSKRTVGGVLSDLTDLNGRERPSAIVCGEGAEKGANKGQSCGEMKAACPALAQEASAAEAEAQAVMRSSDLVCVRRCEMRELLCTVQQLRAARAEEREKLARTKTALLQVLELARREAPRSHALRLQIDDLAREGLL